MSETFTYQYLARIVFECYADPRNGALPGNAAITVHVSGARVKTISSTAALPVLGMCTAQAQAQAITQDADIQQLFGQEPTRFDKVMQPTPQLYGKNLGGNANDQSFKGMFKTDPKLLFGIDIAPGWSLEAGYVNLFDRGFHRIDERDARHRWRIGDSWFSHTCCSEVHPAH